MAGEVILFHMAPAEELNAAYRLQQLLIDQFNAAAPALEPAELAGFRKDWEGRLQKLHARINELRAIVEPPVTGEKMDSPEQQGRYERKVAARKSMTWDAALKNHPFLAVAAKAAVELDPLEDFTAYTEVDPNSHLTVAANTITATGLTTSEDAYIYKDFGVGSFGNFEHLMRTQVTSMAENSDLGFWAVSNVLDDLYYWWTHNSQAIYCTWWNASGTIRIYFRCPETSGSDYAAGLSLSTNYYPKIIRSGVTGTAVIYTNAARTDVFDTLTISVPSGRTYRYVFAAETWNAGAAPACSGISADLDLQLPGSPFFFHRFVLGRRD